MAKLGSNREDGSVGVDIGSHSIKVAVVSGASETPLMEAYNIREISHSGEKPDISREVRAAFSEMDLKPKSVNISLSGPDVIVRFINLPKMSKEQLDAALIFEAEKYIPFNVREVVLDSIILGEGQEPGQMKVLLAAVKRAPVEERARIFSDMGIQVNFVDVNAFACFNAFMAASPDSASKVVALLEIGHSHTYLLISIGGKPFFMRQIQMGGRDMDILIARNLSVPPEKASEYKRGEGDFDKEAVDNCVKKVLNDIAREVHLSFGYFEGACSKPIDGIYCSGGLVYAAGAMEYLSEKMSVSLEKWDPVSAVKTAETISRKDMESVSSCLAVSVGLALRA